MTIARHGAASPAEQNGVTSLAVTVPQQVAVNDVLVSFISVSGGAATLPPGWSRHVSNVGSLAVEYLDYLVITDPAVLAGLASSYTWAGFTSGRATGFMQPMSGVDNANPWDTAGTTGTHTGPGSTCVVTSLTTATPGAMLVSGCCGNAAVGLLWTPPPGFGFFAASTGIGRGAAFATDLIQPAAGPSGAETWTWSQTGLEMRAVMGALRPALYTPANIGMDGAARGSSLDGAAATAGSLDGRAAVGSQDNTTTMTGALG
jgi:hypothetical protein